MCLSVAWSVHFGWCELSAGRYVISVNLPVSQLYLRCKVCRGMGGLQGMCAHAWLVWLSMWGVFSVSLGGLECAFCMMWAFCRQVRNPMKSASISYESQVCDVQRHGRSAVYLCVFIVCCLAPITIALSQAKQWLCISYVCRLVCAGRYMRSFQKLLTGTKCLHICWLEYIP